MNNVGRPRVLHGNMLLTSMRFSVVAVLMAAACGGDDVMTQCDPCPDGGSPDSDACCTNITDASLDAPFVCDPVAQTGCSGGQACYSDAQSVNGMAVYTYYCATPGAGAEAANCTQSMDCAAGYWCATGGINKCTRYCVSAAQCSTTSPTCANYQGMQPWGYCACLTSNPPGIGTCS